MENKGLQEQIFRHIKCIKRTSFHTKQELASVKNSDHARTHRLCKITKKNWAVFQTAQKGKSASAHHTNFLTVIMVRCNFVILLELCYKTFFVVLYCFPVRHKRPFLCLKILMLFRVFTSLSLGAEPFCSSAE